MSIGRRETNKQTKYNNPTHSAIRILTGPTFSNFFLFLFSLYIQDNIITVHVLQTHRASATNKTTKKIERYLVE